MTQSLVLAQKMRSLTNQGIQRQTEDFLTQAPGDWYYEQQELGFNYRMTEMQAALGLSQLKRIDAFLAHRWQAFDHYQVLLADLPFILPYQDPQQRSSLHLFPILVPPEWINYKRDIFHFLRQNGIGTQVHYIPVHTQPYYQNLGFAWGDFPQAEDYYARTLSLPLFATITLEQQQIVAQRLAQAIDACIPESKRSLGAVRLNTVGQ